MKPSEILIAHPKSDLQISALKAFLKALEIKFEVAKASHYSPSFIEKIEESQEQFKKGEFISLEKKDIKSFLNME